MLTRYRRSMYYHFLVAMILLDLLMLVSIMTNLMSDYFTLAAWLKGSAMCKLTAFLTNGGRWEGGLGEVDFLKILRFQKCFLSITDLHFSGTYSVYIAIVSARRAASSPRRGDEAS